MTVTPSSRTEVHGETVDPAIERLGPWPFNFRRLLLVPNHNSSVLSAFNFNRFEDIQSYRPVARPGHTRAVPGSPNILPGLPRFPEKYIFSTKHILAYVVIQFLF